MSYQYHDNTNRIISERANKVSLALRFCLDGIHRESLPNTPKLTGQLRRDITKKVLGKTATITWGKRYAAAQDIGRMTVRKTRTFKTSDGNWVTLKPGVYYFRKYTTPGTSRKFAENSAKQEGNNPRKYLKLVGL